MNINLNDELVQEYSMKVYGDIGDSSIADELTEWETFTSTKQVSLTDGNGNKTIKVKVRDDVYNESIEYTANINLDVTVPEVTVVAPDIIKISNEAGKETASFSFNCTMPFVEAKVKVVPTENSTQEAGVAILDTNGSTNMNWAGEATKTLACTINGLDYQMAVGGADGVYIVKVFVKNSVGTWSV